MVAIAVSSGAMIVVFSVFNGLESVVKDMYKDFYPDLRISVARGKFFPMTDERLAVIKQLPGVRNISEVIEDNVFAVNHDQQKVIVLKGIDNNYFNVNDIRQYIVAGDDSVSAGDVHTAIAGSRTMNELGVDINTLSYIILNYANPTVADPTADPLSAFESLKLHPAGVFKIGDEFDDKYVLAPLSLAQELFHQKGRYSSIEISAEPGAIKGIQRQLRDMLGKDYRVETRYEQNRTLFMVMGSEKWAVYAILVLVLLIASFNMVGALSMLVLEKQKDIAILKAMGAQHGTIRKIFLLEGVLWSLVGGVAGILLGCGICLVQLQFGIVKMGGSFLVDAFPVEIQVRDILLDIATILAVGVLTSWYPAMRATKAVDPTLKST